MEALDRFLGFYGEKVGNLDKEIHENLKEKAKVEEEIRVLNRNMHQLGSSDQISRY